jgi:SAM-dependent methyltransferase
MGVELSAAARTSSAQPQVAAGAAFDWPIVCPRCRVPLDYGGQAFSCRRCGRSYPIKKGVICFQVQDDFYEGRYPALPLHFLSDERLPWGLGLLYLVSMHYLWYIRQYVPKSGRILDVACGAGMRYLPTRGIVAGLEVSFSSACEMAKIYDLALQGTGLNIPLDDNSVDAVVSRFFLEHVLPGDKAGLLAEFHRVLKPGGWLITLQDCECNNALWRWARQDRVLFQQRFVDNDGHYGLMYASKNLALLRQAGFKLVAYHASNKTPLVHLPMLEWMQPYRRKSILAAFLLHLASIINQHRWLNQVYTLLLTLFDDLMEPFLPLDHARYLLAACQVNKG